VAKKGKFDAFTSTLLYSKMQDRTLIVQLGENLGKEQGVRFLDNDFSEGWKEGIDASKAMDMYRQQYCGCIYSEKERFYKKPKSK
jgi:predicted adenine nucleotide alpha hydrolase (AANH) superfamily ATPase